MPANFENSAVPTGLENVSFHSNPKERQCQRMLKLPHNCIHLNCKEIQPVHSKGDQSWMFMEGLMLKLKLQYFGHMMWRTDSLEKTLMLGKTEGRRRRDDRGWDGWMAPLTRWTYVWVNTGSWWWTGRPGMLQSLGSQRVGHDWVAELNWTGK